MDFDLTDKTLYLTIVPPLGCLLRLSDEGSGFVQVLLDFSLQGRGGDCSPQRRAMVDLPRMIDRMFGLMDHLGALRMRMMGRIKRAGLDRRSPYERSECNSKNDCYVVCHVYASVTITPLIRTV